MAWSQLVVDYIDSPQLVLVWTGSPQLVLDWPDEPQIVLDLTPALVVELVCMSTKQVAQVIDEIYWRMPVIELINTVPCFHP